MRVLVIGSGGREHAIVWALSRSSGVDKIFCAPGNGGIQELAELVPISVNDFDGLGQFALEKEVGLVVVGPDDPLADGIVDHLQGMGLKVFGPNKAAAQIEGSKIFMKDLCHKYRIPTAAYETFDDAERALTYIREQGAPIVLKADGLAAGKGVIVAETLEEAEAAIDKIMLQRAFGDAGERIIVEEFLAGQEVSILAFVDGDTVRPMIEAQDHKPAYDGDEGPNTGGMGTYAPVPQICRAQLQQAVETIIEPAARAMVQEGRSFSGVLFAGLMMTTDGPRLIEFNARFGDPETQVVLPLLKTDLFEVLLATAEGRLDQVELQWKEGAAVCVILASGGYPTSYEKGFAISGLDQVDTLVFHAGTKVEAGGAVTNGGRVLGVVATGPDVATARAKAYEEAVKIDFEGRHMRSDIALKAALPV